MRRIGVLLFAAEDRAAINPFLSGLEALGYTDGKTVAIAYREVAGNYERAPDLANELVRLNPEVIFSFGGDLAPAIKNATAFLSDLRACEKDLYLHVQALDTSTPSGRAMFGMLGVFSEFERSIIQERVRAGLQRARSKGVRLGRTPTSPEVDQRIRELLATGMGKLKIARQLGIGTSVVQRVAAN
jgi:hypothetical protein